MAFCLIFQPSLNCTRTRLFKTHLIGLCETSQQRKEFLYCGFVLQVFLNCGKLFEPEGISYLFGVIVRVKVVFRKTVVGE